MIEILTPSERLRLMVEAEADRLAPEYATQIIYTVCEQGGYDFQLALKTYVRDGEPWYVTRAQAALLSLSIEEQLCNRTRKDRASFGCGGAGVVGDAA